MNCLMNQALSIKLTGLTGYIAYLLLFKKKYKEPIGGSNLEKASLPCQPCQTKLLVI